MTTTNARPHVFLNAVSAISALGATGDDLRARLFADVDPMTLRVTDQYSPGRPLHLGCVPGNVVLPALDFAAPVHRSRNNALAWAAMLPLRSQVDDLIARFGKNRVALIVGTSTGGLDEGAHAADVYRRTGQFPEGFDYRMQELGDVAAFLARGIGIAGPAHSISTACSSGAKALASAARMLASGMVDAVVAGGVDALSAFTVAGFSALDAVSSERCNPLSANRHGINLGEAAAFFVMTRETGPVRLAGWGESQDAHHMSAPDPTGRGAISAMQQALDRARMTAAQVDYINLHGTATPHNDAMESLAVNTLFGDACAVSSTKPLTGHSLAAAGALEAAICWHVLYDNPDGKLPAHWWDGATDDTIARLQIAPPKAGLGRPAKAVLSNSFAFGGSNCALLFAAGESRNG
ncbi:beta-ketoacyl-ACP synthase [Diaphorobacter aerolatus]|uniref:Beta-ketoacyl-ACP synthase n=1 Tax=Diaphorobacter aerolatus TaxID=1288495 RepID=A0A7H0GM07_9BURK|nr:beta-ketoacyl-ACP synthase [Diaphorobacter aerolatus]QNP49323.1 beta-ketoacyl-ACP synthase [Diaphorobacter aerolatus]